MSPAAVRLERRRARERSRAVVAERRQQRGATPAAVARVIARPATAPVRMPAG
jgi:hypothetical protein